MKRWSPAVETPPTGGHDDARPPAVRVVAVVSALVVAVVVALAGCAGDTGGGASADVANPGYASGDGTVTTWGRGDRGAPVGLVGTTYDGDVIDLVDWRGDVVVVNFWYAGCPPCRAEAPDLVALAEDYAEDGVHLLGVNSTDDTGTAQAFERTFGVPYPTLDDARAHGVAAMQGVVALRAMPTTVVLDPDGRIAARVLGRIDPSTLRAIVDDELPAAPA